MGGLNVGRRALAAEVLRDNQHHAVLANGGFLGAGAIDIDLAGAVVAPQREVENLGFEAAAHLLEPVGANVLGEAGNARAESRLQVGAVDGLTRAGPHLREQGGPGDILFLLALGHGKVG